MESNPQNCSTDSGPRFHFASERSPEAFAAGAADDDGHDRRGPAEALKDASARFGELKEYVSLLIATKVDGVKLTIRRIVLYAILGVVGAVIGVAMLVTAAVYVLSGIAGGIGAAFPDPYGWWAGRLIVGVVVVGASVAGVFVLMKSLTGSSRKRTIDKYENRKRVERNLYGHDVAERAKQQAEHERQTTGA
jgi:hypothetical protein